MRQLLQNLIGNSLKYRRPETKPLVKVRGETSDGGHDLAEGGTHPPGHFCRISVEDNGIGFDEKYLDRVFTVFQRLHGRTGYEGTGIGLAVCRKIAERHGGSITARSAPLKGATFIVTLPVRQLKGGEAN
jgi:signal transduction histidine kinase